MNNITSNHYQCKIFRGEFNETSADDIFNKWITEHPNINIIEFKYDHQRFGNHSICILYKEEK